MATGAEKHTPLLPVWPLGLPFVFLCQKVRSLLIFLADSRPADVLVGNWDRGKPAAFDFTVSSPLSSAILSEANANTGAAARSAEECKHRANDVKCAELGWSCVPLAVEPGVMHLFSPGFSFLCGICLAQG